MLAAPTRQSQISVPAKLSAASTAEPVNKVLKPVPLMPHAASYGHFGLTNTISCPDDTVGHLGSMTPLSPLSPWTTWLQHQQMSPHPGLHTQPPKIISEAKGMLLCNYNCLQSALLLDHLQPCFSSFQLYWSSSRKRQCWMSM